MVAKWLERWKHVVWVPRATCRFRQELKSDHELLYWQTSGATLIIFYVQTFLATGRMRRNLLIPSHPWPDPKGKCFIAESHPLVTNTLANRPFHEFWLMPWWSPIPVVKVSAWFLSFTNSGGKVKERWKHVVWVSRATCMFSQKLKRYFAWVAVCTN